MKRSDRGAVGVAALVLTVLGTGAGGALAQAQGVFAGQTYGEADAERGRAAYAENCALCHGADLGSGEFGPALKGAGFAAHWQGQNAQQLLAYIQTRMPPSGPGSLDTRTYGDITAFVLKTNGAAAGASSAPAPAASAAATPPARPPAPPPPTVPRAKDAQGEATVAAWKAKLAAVAPVTDAMLASPKDGDWLIWRRTYGAQGFSNLKQVTKANVGGLRQVWSWSLPPSQNEIAPLVHDGVMFVASGNAVQALDAANGDLLWQYIRPLPDALQGGRANRPKALTLYGNRIYAPTADRHLVALDIRTGAVVWDHEIIAAPTDGRGDAGGLQLVSGPIAARGKIILGVSLGISRGRGGCYILALDAETGKEVWRFNTVDQNAPGQDSWNGAPVNERFGGGVWTSGSYDPVRKLLFFGTGNTYSAGTLLLPHAQKGASNDALYTDSTLAIDPDTGKLVWHYQHMSRDVWDMDWVFEQTLATLPIDGKPRDVVVTGGKIAIFDVMDRATGQYLFSHDLGMTNLVTAIDPKTGKKTTNPALAPESGVTKLLCPASTGARNWPTTALNPNTHILYVPMMESCSNWTWTARTPAEVANGGIDMTYPPTLRPNSDGKFGRIAAINLATRKVAWTVRQRSPIASSMLATAGGIVFNGSLDRRFAAFDEMTGKVLWETRLNAAPSSSPVTYEVNGEQYVAVVSGGGGAFDGGGRFVTPEVENPNGGTTVVVFKLPGGRKGG